ncbi:MAG: hypothetical protein ACLU4J_19245 [Butyricimonas paravirosa]
MKWRMKLNGSRNWNRFEKSSDGFVLGTMSSKSLYNIKAYQTDG